MAYTSRTIDAHVNDVWEALIDPTTYPQWLIGTQSIREIDADWPRPGSGFRHRVGAGPLTLGDRTTVRAVTPNEMLELDVRARPFVAACVRFELVTDGNRTVLNFEEIPRGGALSGLARPVIDPLTHVRNHRSLLRFDRLVLGRVHAVAGLGDAAGTA